MQGNFVGSPLLDITEGDLKILLHLFLGFLVGNVAGLDELPSVLF